jgi:hypothetical protein
MMEGQLSTTKAFVARGAAGGTLPFAAGPATAGARSLHGAGMGRPKIKMQKIYFFSTALVFMSLEAAICSR